MIVQVISTNLNATKVSKAGKTLTGLAIVYQPQPYDGRAKDPVDRFVFSDSPIAAAIGNVEAGDWIEIMFDNTQWKNPLSLVKTQAPAEQGAAEKYTGENMPKPSGKSSGVDWDLKDKKIARAVAFKGAIETVAALIGTEGAFPKAALKKPDFFVEQVIDMSKKFEPYLNYEDTDNSNDEQTTTSGDVPFNQEQFGE
jgi:hypothetical protein